MFYPTLAWAKVGIFCPERITRLPITCNLKQSYMPAHVTLILSYMGAHVTLILTPFPKMGLDDNILSPGAPARPIRRQFHCRLIQIRRQFFLVGP